MKKNLLLIVLFICTQIGFAQTKNKKFNITGGGFIQHYNGNLGNSFFQFKTVCFAGTRANLNTYLNHSFDASVGFSIGHFGYVATQKDIERTANIKLRCPGCAEFKGMGELRSLMTSANVSITYKFANGYLLNENSKFSPYIYAGAGINYLSDVMKRNCVNAGTNYSANMGAGIKYNITDRINVGYNLGIGYFLTKKVYLVNEITPNAEQTAPDADDIKFEKRKDMYMQNSLMVGYNF
ncbi:MAG: hypothetical protein RL708_2540 [Bacteroidota bacterium]|jgi:opacity protein-like surface antigen